MSNNELKIGNKTYEATEVQLSNSTLMALIDGELKQQIKDIKIEGGSDEAKTKAIDELEVFAENVKGYLQIKDYKKL
jgi:hypothetical protein